MLARGYLRIAKSATAHLDSVRALHYSGLQRRPRKAGAEALGPQDFRVLGPFCLVRKEEHGGGRDEALPGERLRGEAGAARKRSSGPGETQAQMVDLKFCDLLGTWQHVTLPITAFDESAFDEGLGFDGSSIRGWQSIAESDMLLMPDPASAVLDPFTEAPTLSLVCEIADPLTREGYAQGSAAASPGGPRQYLTETGIADTAYFGPECEFFVFDSVSYELGRPPLALRDRLRRGPLELRRARARLHGPAEGGLLPAGSARHAARPAHARWC